MTAYLQHKTLFPPQIYTRPSPLLGMVVVIPCHDEDFLLLSLMSLRKCDRPQCDIEVIVVINDSLNAPEAVKLKNRNTYEQAIRWGKKNNLSHLRFHILYHDELPEKQAGVGLARKIGMDEACFRLQKAGNPKGIIACFDADSRCEPNYFQALEAHFFQNRKAQACGLYFEHPLNGMDFDEKVYDAIAAYELHLRYYVHAQRWAGYPHACQTIGSSMAVRCDAYQQQGGMNRRQAGEDFYFLHKFIPLGHFSEITCTKVIPSPRPSHRVPFGTGKAVGELLKSGGRHFTYNPNSFQDLQIFLKTGKPEADDWRDGLPESVIRFLTEQDFEEKLEEIKVNTSGREAFRKRFFRWFDAFMVMKYVHFARENFYPDLEVTEAAAWLLNTAYNHQTVGAEKERAKGLLQVFRNLDRRLT